MQRTQPTAGAAIGAAFSLCGAALHRLLQRAEVAAKRLVGSTVPQPGAADPFAGLLPWDLASRVALDVPPRATTGRPNADYGATLLDFAGVCTLQRAVAPALAAACCSAAERLTDEVRATVRTRGFEPDDAAERGFRFFEACHRGPGRLDLRNRRLLEAPFDQLEHSEGAAWMPIVQAALGGEARLLWRGLVVTEPGTPQQAWHADGPSVSYDEWRRHGVDRRVGASLPAHCLTVFVPLCDLRPENGPTLFLPGTHHAATGAALADEANEGGCSGGAGSPVALEARAGDAIIFDYRLFHAGGANASASRRPVLYFVYGRPWFEDTHNFPGPEASLFGEARR